VFDMDRQSELSLGEMLKSGNDESFEPDSFLIIMLRFYG